VESAAGGGLARGVGVLQADEIFGLAGDDIEYARPLVRGPGARGERPGRSDPADRRDDALLRPASPRRLLPELGQLSRPSLDEAGAADGDTLRRGPADLVLCARLGRRA